MAGPSTSELWSRVVSGDERALADFLAEQAPSLRHHLAAKIPARLRGVLSVDDVLQQTYIDAFLDLDRLAAEGVRSPTAWLTSLAECNLTDALRMLEAEKREHGHRLNEIRSHGDSTAALYEQLLATDSTPSRIAAREEACRALQGALGCLPESYRRVVQMYDLEDRSVEDVAQALQRSPGAVYMIRGRAHRLLRGLLGSPSSYLSRT